MSTFAETPEEYRKRLGIPEGSISQKTARELLEACVMARDKFKSLSLFSDMDNLINVMDKAIKKAEGELNESN